MGVAGGGNDKSPLPAAGVFGAPGERGRERKSLPGWGTVHTACPLLPNPVHHPRGLYENPRIPGLQLFSQTG